MDLKTVKETATILGVHPNTIRTMINDGRLTATKLGPRLTLIDINQIKPNQ